MKCEYFAFGIAKCLLRSAELVERPKNDSFDRHFTRRVLVIWDWQYLQQTMHDWIAPE